MDVVVWNMNHRTVSWAGLKTLDPDVALLSEARVPEDLGMSSQGGQSTEGRDRYPRGWAAAIATKHQLRPVQDARASRYGRPLNLPFETARPGKWEAAVVVRDGHEPIT